MGHTRISIRNNSVAMHYSATIFRHTFKKTTDQSITAQDEQPKENNHRSNVVLPALSSNRVASALSQMLTPPKAIKVKAEDF
jgi:hypothetical protein